jgi:hypothetical protein
MLSTIFWMPHLGPVDDPTRSDFCPCVMRLGSFDVAIHEGRLSAIGSPPFSE